jgi:cytochrome c oxidase assembly factor CtaG
VFAHWSASWPAVACYVVVAAAHLTGLGRTLPAGVPARVFGPAADAGRRSRQQAVAFQGGLLLALLTLVPPISYLSGLYLWVRALQFLLLAFVATGLMVLGAPWLALGAAVRPGRSARRQPDRPVASEQAGLPHGTVPGVHGRPGRSPVILAHPLIAVIAVNVVWLGWQVPLLYDAATNSSVVALASHAAYLAAGFVFWLQVIGSAPFSPATPPLRRLRLVIGTVGAMTIVGMVLVFGSNVVYSGYANSVHHVVTVLDDQQLSGAVLWMGSLLPLVTVGVALLMRWLNDEESAELSAGLDRLLTPRKNAWSRSGIR